MRAFCIAVLVVLCAAFKLAATELFAQEPSKATRIFLQKHLASYRSALEQARCWLDGLDVDPILLRSKGIKGKKKFVELLDAYARLYRSSSSNEAALLLHRFKEIAEITYNPAYHDMALISDEWFKQDATSYMRAAYLIKKMGLNVDLYVAEIKKIKDKLDKHMPSRGVDQRMAFHWYYSAFNLQEPFPLMEAYKKGLIATRVPAAALAGNMNAYNLTHEIFIPYEYGDKLNAQFFTKDDVAYLKDVLKSLATYHINDGNIDILCEIITCMRFLKLTDLAEYREGLSKILSSQNENGSWGNYEFLRPNYGNDIDVALYLHTTLVAIDALTVAFYFYPYL